MPACRGTGSRAGQGNGGNLPISLGSAWPQPVHYKNQNDTRAGPGLVGSGRRVPSPYSALPLATRGVSASMFVRLYSACPAFAETRTTSPVQPQQSPKAATTFTADNCPFLPFPAHFMAHARPAKPPRSRASRGFFGDSAAMPCHQPWFRQSVFSGRGVENGNAVPIVLEIMPNLLIYKYKNTYRSWVISSNLPGNFYAIT